MCEKMIRYYIFKLAIRIAKWACVWGFTYDHLDMAEDQEYWYMMKEHGDD